MTTTQLTKPTTLQTYTHNDNTLQTTQSEVEQYIYNLIQQGDIFIAKLQMQLINRTNGYEVISSQMFKCWHVEYIRSDKSNIKSSDFHKKYQKAYMKLISN